MQEMSSSDLLTMVSIDPSDPECKKAFEVFHERYKDFVWKISFRFSLSIDSHNANKVAMVVAQNTFMKIYEKANVFKPRTSDCNIDCMSWISGIVRNMGKQYLQENNKHKDHIVFMEVLPDAEEFSNHSNELPVYTINRKILSNALKTLSNKEKQILLAWYNFYSEGKVRAIDKDIKESLAKQFNVKVDSLKKIKERALKKLLSYIEKH